MKKDKGSEEGQRIKEQVKAFDLMAGTEESAMDYVGDFSEVGWSKEKLFESGSKDAEECTAAFFKEMDFNPGDKRMLDIGCGVGRITRAFAGIFGEANGADFSSNMVKVAKKLNKDIPNAHFKVNNGVDLSIYDDNIFDFCFSFVVFHHIPSFKVVASYVREIDRILKPGGLFMFQVNTTRWVKVFGWLPIPRGLTWILARLGVINWFNRTKVKDSTTFSALPLTTPVYYTSPKKLEKVLRDTTLDVVKITGQNQRHTWYCGRKKPL